MSKIMTIPSSKESINNLINVSDAFLIGIENMSVNLPIYFKINEIKEIISYLNGNNKEVFVALNKNMHNKDLTYLKEVMLMLNDYDIKGIFYYDIAVVNIYKKLDLKYDLVWAQEHLSTNYHTCNYWYNFGAKFTLIAREITLDEIAEIKENTKSKLIVPIFGHLTMFVSKRNLVKNYLDYFNLKDNSNINYIEKENNIYPIIDDNNGTNVYSANILNGLEESLMLRNLNIDYLLLNSFNINEDSFNKIVSFFYNVNEENKKEYSNNIGKLLDKPIDKGFLYKETVYKVKNNG
jgi:putative protease